MNAGSQVVQGFHRTTARWVGYGTRSKRCRATRAFISNTTPCAAMSLLICMPRSGARMRTSSSHPMSTQAMRCSARSSSKLLLQSRTNTNAARVHGCWQRANVATAASELFNFTGVGPLNQTDAVQGLCHRRQLCVVFTVLPCDRSYWSHRYILPCSTAWRMLPLR